MKHIKILDLTRVLAGPWACQHLADQGAQVIKVEPPQGDETRHFGPLHHGESTYVLCANRNKRSIALDLKTPAGLAVLEALLAQSDVVVENFRPGVAARLGLDWEALHARWPQLIYVAIHAFGDRAAGWRERPGYDLLLQHMGGATTLTGWPGDPPTKHPTSIADLTAGLYATQAVLQGLLQREWTGEGQKIVVNMMQTQATCLAYHATRWAAAETLDEQRGNAHAGIVPYDVFKCLDGWLVIACANDPTWRRLRAALQLEDRPEWSTNAGRVADRTRLTECLTQTLSRLTIAEAEERLAEASVPAGPVLRPDQALAHPAVDRIALEHPRLGTLDLPGPAFRTSTTLKTHRAPPDLGADRDEILREIGLFAEVDRLQEAGAFG
ncbi:MAG: CoA transferase [Deltaproteobacteria bacterium]|nr:MAG: CoA transferase [Deltaproteobacteria bacterium]